MILDPNTPTPTPPEPALRRRAAVCPYCGVGCRITADVVGQRIVNITADKQAMPNYGMLCQKGAMLKSPGIWDPAGRLSYPMMRERRDAPMRRATWDQVADFVADRFSTIRAEHGRDSIAFYGSGQLDTEASYVFNKLFKGALGTNNMDTNSRLCMSSAVSGYIQSFGCDGPPTSYDDLFAAEVYLVAGANMAVNHPVLFNMMRKRMARHPHLKLIVMDPRRTQTAAAADIHVPLAPGGDVAFLHLVSRRLMDRGRVDEDYIAAHTEGFDAYREHLMALDEAALLAACDVDEAVIKRVVETLAKPARLLSLYCQGFNQSIRGVDKNTALINLHLQLGEIGKPGAGPFSLTGQPNAMGGREVGYLCHQLPGYRFVTDAEHRAAVERHWNLPEQAISEAPGLSAVAMFEALARGRIKAIWTACTNPVVSMPDAATTRAALETAELVIHQDCYHPTETGRFADVLLPAAQWGEKTGTMTNSERLVSRSQKLFEAPGVAMPDWWIAARIGRAMGFEGFDYVTSEQVWDEYRKLTAGTLCDQSGMTNARLARGPLRWPCPSEDHPGTVRRYEDGVFPTPGGRARFITAPAAPGIVADETPDDEYPMVLTTGRIAGQWHTRTRTGKVPELTREDAEPFVEVHPSDAKALGLRDGQPAQIIGRRGTAIARARLATSIRPGLVFATFHFGDSFAADVNINDLTNPAFDPISKQPELKYCAVRLVPVESPLPRKEGQGKGFKDRTGSVAFCDAETNESPSPPPPSRGSSQTAEATHDG